MVTLKHVSKLCTENIKQIEACREDIIKRLKLGIQIVEFCKNNTEVTVVTTSDLMENINNMEEDINNYDPELNLELSKIL